MKLRILASLLTLTGLNAFGQPGLRNTPRLPEGTKALRDVACFANGHERQILDLLIPSGAINPLPLIIWVHGGGWQSGSKEQCQAFPYLQKGCAAASINYRLSQQAIFPAQIQYCKAAVRWLRAYAKEYNLDPNRFAVWGTSAGGHLVALLGTTGDVKTFDVGENLGFSSRVQAVVDFFGPADFTQMAKYSLPNSRINHDAPEAKLIGGAVPENQEEVAAANPSTCVAKNNPPFLIMHGNKDNLVPYQQSEMLRDALQKAGVPVTLKIGEGAGHGFGGRDIDREGSGFLERRLKSPARPSGK